MDVVYTTSAVDDNYPDYVYGEDDDTPEYEESYDDVVDVSKFI